VYTNAQEEKMGKRKRYAPEEKLKILREVVEENKPISQVAEQYELHPNCIFKWRKQFLENGSQVFQIKRPDISSKADKRRIELLEEQLRQKNEVIAWLTEEHLALKKKYTGL
jgi:transposase-like protein